MAAFATAEQRGRGAVLGQKLVQLTMPGVPDVYQGSELVDLSLVDPDNRRPVDFAAPPRAAGPAGRGEKPATSTDEKLLVTSRALRLRREHPEWFVGDESTYAPVATTTGNAIAFGARRRRGSRRDRGGDPAVGVARAVRRLGRAHGRPAGVRNGWRDVLTGREAPAAAAPAGRPAGRPARGAASSGLTDAVAQLAASRSFSASTSKSAAGHCGSISLQGVEEQLLHGQPGVPLAVRRHDVPRRGVGRALGRTPPGRPPGSRARARARRRRPGCTSSACPGARAARPAAPSARRARCAA